MNKVKKKQRNILRERGGMGEGEKHEPDFKLERNSIGELCIKKKKEKRKTKLETNQNET